MKIAKTSIRAIRHTAKNRFIKPSNDYNFYPIDIYA